jgi:hypothetical protein
MSASGQTATCRARKAQRFAPSGMGCAHDWDLACLICATGKSLAPRSPLSTPFVKNISLLDLVETAIERSGLALVRRGVRVVTNVGCGMRWTFSGPTTKGTKADGEVVWS